MKSSFGIVILSYNHPEHTARCVTSTLKHVVSEKVFLVHNGSLPKHRSQLQIQFPHLNHIILDQNKGFTGGANAGLEIAFKKHEHILFLTNDTELIQLPTDIPDCLSSVVVLRRNSEQVDSVMGELILPQGKLRHLRHISEMKTDSLEKKYYVPGSAFWIPQRVFTKTLGFDESLHSYWEDVDLSLRIPQLEEKLGFSKNTIVRHKMGKTTAGQDFYTYYLYQKNRKIVLKKHHLTSLIFYLQYLIDVFRLSRYRYKLLWKILIGK